MTVRTRTALSVLAGTAAVLTVGACSSGGGSAAATAPAATVTATQTVSSAAPPTGSGVPASSSGAASGSGSTASSGPIVCTPTVMRFEVGPPNGAAGTLYFEVTATNGSASPCVTTGFPGVAFLDGAGAQFVQAQRDDTVQKTQLTVQPGASVTATIGAVDVAGGGGGCTDSSTILFTMPDNTDSTKLTVPTGQVCSAKVEAFVSGTGS